MKLTVTMNDGTRYCNVLEIKYDEREYMRIVYMDDPVDCAYAVVRDRDVKAIELSGKTIK